MYCVCFAIKISVLLLIALGLAKHEPPFTHLESYVWSRKTKVLAFHTETFLCVNVMVPKTLRKCYRPILATTKAVGLMLTHNHDVLQVCGRRGVLDCSGYVECVVLIELECVDVTGNN